MRRGREVNALAYLRARSHQRVAVYHRPFVHVGAGVHEHRRHADHARRHVGTVAYARASGHDAYVVFDSCRTCRISILVKEAEGGRSRHIDKLAHAKSDQDSLFDPGVHAPYSFLRALGGANLAFILARVIEQGKRRGDSPERVRRVLSPDALTIGFARRFATYKRANLILADIEKLASMVNDPKRPVQFVFAGKAHPHDEPGKRVLQQIAELMHHRHFADKFVFVEDYDINVGRHLVQGVDAWLNNPRRPQEASGTSGEKVVLNGGLNLSVLDGWWAEAFDGLNGFAIGTGRTHSNMDVHDRRDGEDLYRTLRDEVIPLYYQRDRDVMPSELPSMPQRPRARGRVLLEEVIPLYYQRDHDGLPRGWIRRMKRTIRTLGWRFNADRMVMDYTLKCYVPAAGGTSDRAEEHR